ncbi:MAG: CYTH domain-containing protein [Chromatiaceae bacterium]|nr:CYTH domain-containing protein [Gammaproteobacteria bacterium]MCP5428318.1 CYTH domain-containing protein [Chromatiaceae bacterium]MCB1860226.1 CYTH domain-containing protein [Gammaproteobacteria bacterium]MCB1871359.1 CYTH domain-containing protein [Gammaproteobacteria bacterium]MCB1878446.1 CYTH domain-containing protein [Gammaproteobacteria bacterium]
MGLEIERKYLVINDLWKNNVIAESHLQQGYLANQKNASIRIRTGNGKAHLNIKSTTVGIRRLEYEYEIPIADAREMLREIALQPYIEKTRYIVRNGGHDWELDVFAGENRGLIVAELELDSEDEPFELPVWAGEEVSGDVKYYNVNLINHPYSRW